MVSLSNVLRCMEKSLDMDSIIDGDSGELNDRPSNGDKMDKMNYLMNRMADILATALNELDPDQEQSSSSVNATALSSDFSHGKCRVDVTSSRRRLTVSLRNAIGSFCKAWTSCHERHLVDNVSRESVGSATGGLAADSSMYLLSVKQEMILYRTVDFLIALGIYPYLDEFGIRIHMRDLALDPGTGRDLTTDRNKLKDHMLDIMNLCLQDDGLLDSAGFDELCLSADTLWNICSLPSIGSKMLAKDSFALIAALFRIGFGPQPTDCRRPDPTDPQNAFNRYTSPPTAPQSALVARERLVQLKKRMYLPTLISNVFSLQRNAKTTTPGKPVKWLVDYTGRYLTQCLLEPNGLRYMFQVITDQCGDRSKSDWNVNAYEAIAKVITTCPRCYANQSDRYYRSLCDQLFDLLVFQLEKDEPDDTRHLIFECIRRLSAERKEQTERYLFSTILSPLQQLTDPFESPPSQFLPSDDDLTRSIQLIGFLTAASSGSGHIDMDLSWLMPYIGLFCQLYASLMTTTSFLRKTIEDIVVAMLDWCAGQDNWNGSDIVLRIISARPASDTEIVYADGSPLVSISNRLRVEPGPSSSIHVALCEPAPSEVTTVEAVTGKVEALVALLKAYQQVKPSDAAEVIGEVITKSLKLVMIQQDPPPPDGATVANSSSTQQLGEGIACLSMLVFVELLLEHFAEVVLSNKSSILNICEVVLDEILPSETVSSNSCSKLKTQRYELIFGLLTAVLTELSLAKVMGEHPLGQSNSSSALPTRSSGGQSAVEDNEEMMRSTTWTSLGQKLIKLTKLKAIGSQTKAQANDIIQLMAMARMDQQQHLAAGKGFSASERQFVGESLVQPGVASTSSSSPSIPSRYIQAIEECQPDSEPYLRGHGLIALRQLLDEDDQEAIDNRSHILAIAKAALEDTDSYIYLSGVNLCATLGERYPEDVIPMLMDQFTQWNPEPKHSSSSSSSPAAALSEVRMNVGEVLMRIVRQLGDMGPIYAELMLGPFLALAKPSGQRDEEHIRASALSNLGELAKLMKYKISGCLQEILLCIQEILKWDEHDVVRRAAIHLLTCLIKGVDRSMLEVLGDDMLEIYRLVKRCCEDKDETVRLHAQLCRDEIDRNLKGIFLEDLIFNARRIKEERMKVW